MKLKLTSPVTPPLVYEHPTFKKEIALEILNDYLAPLGGRPRHRLPRYYRIDQIDLMQPITTPEEWQISMKEMADDAYTKYLYSDRTSNHPTGAAQLVAPREKTKYSNTNPVNPPQGQSPSIWWQCHFPALHPLVFGRGGYNLPAISFICAAPAPSSPDDNVRARHVHITEWLRRAALIILEVSATPDLSTPATQYPDSNKWITLDEIKHADMLDMIDSYTARLPDGAKLIPTWLPALHTDPPTLPIHDSRLLPPSAPVMVAHEWRTPSPSLRPYDAPSLFHVVFPNPSNPEHVYMHRTPQMDEWNKSGRNPAEPAYHVNHKTRLKSTLDKLNMIREAMASQPYPHPSRPSVGKEETIDDL